MSAEEYYSKLYEAREIVDKAAFNIENKQTDEYAKDNTSETLVKLYQFRAIIDRMINAHKFMKMSKEKFIQTRDKSAGKMELVHTVKQFETPAGIAEKYGVTVEELINKNNLFSSDLEAGIEIKIDTSISSEYNNATEQIAVLGTHVGTEVFGRDFTKSLNSDSIGDFKIADNLETLQQGVLNRATTSEDGYPLVDDFGLNIAGSDLPEDLSMLLLLTKTSNQILQDKRISEIKNIDIKREGSALKVHGTVKAVNNEVVDI